MGTSSGYKMPTGGNWTPLKNEATDFVQGTGGPEITVDDLVANFVRVHGGFKGLSRGSGGSAPSLNAVSGPGGSSGHGGRARLTGTGGRSRSAVIGTAQNLGGFLSRVSQVGLEEALRERGLGKIVGKPAAEIADALLDEFAGPASTLDNALARESLADIRDEILEGAKTFEDVEKQLNAVIDQIGVFGILASFFGHYIFKMFCRNFYEEWLKKVGDTKATNGLRQIKDYITSSLRTKLATRSIAAVDWKKSEGIRLSEEVLRETIEVFGVTA
jgi:hypothetical protein